MNNQCFMLKYISAEDLGINTKHDRLTAEALFVTHLKPIVYNQEYIMDVVTSMMVKERITSIMRRAETFGKSREDLLNELVFFVEDLDKNIDSVLEQMHDN